MAGSGLQKVGRREEVVGLDNYIESLLNAGCHSGSPQPLIAPNSANLLLMMAECISIQCTIGEHQADVQLSSVLFVHL